MYEYDWSGVGREIAKQTNWCLENCSLTITVPCKKFKTNNLEDRRKNKWIKKPTPPPPKKKRVKFDLCKLGKFGSTLYLISQNHEKHEKQMLLTSLALNIYCI